jgi:nucleotidyltransferase substrate binding protein (TIGR01987 family)
MSYDSKQSYEDLQAAVVNLTQLSDLETLSEIEQDAFLKRFELAYEQSWKCLQQYLQTEGIIARSPRQVFKEAVALGLIDDERLWLEMIEVRNTLVHTYNAVKARALVGNIRSRLVEPLRLLADRLQR